MFRTGALLSELMLQKLISEDAVNASMQASFGILASETSEMSFWSISSLIVGLFLMAPLMHPCRLPSASLPQRHLK